MKKAVLLILFLNAVLAVPVTKMSNEKQNHFCDKIDDTSVSEMCHKERKPLQVCGPELSNLMSTVCGSSKLLSSNKILLILNFFIC